MAYIRSKQIEQFRELVEVLAKRVLTPDEIQLMEECNEALLELEKSKEKQARQSKESMQRYRSTVGGRERSNESARKSQKKARDRKRYERKLHSPYASDHGRRSIKQQQ